jgi:hypothetical protein
MGFLTKGPINLRLYKIRTALSLKELHAIASDSLVYPVDPEHQSSGFGSSWDSIEHVKESVRVPFTGGQPEMVWQPDHGAPKLRLRYYWDTLNAQLRNYVGVQAGWQEFHQRDAVDVVVVDGASNGEHTALVSAREDRLTKAVILPALNALATHQDPGATISADALPEALEPDFYTWLLYKHKCAGGFLANGILVTDIDEIESRDLQKRSGRFGSGAGADRVELLALIAKNQMRFGPAKLSVRFEGEVEGDFDLHIFPDGGFSVYRTSEYKNHREIPAHILGHKLAEDVFEIVLPAMRSLYLADTAWPATERDAFIEQCKAELDAITARGLP